MKYLKFVFENQEVKDLIDSQEENINTITEAIIYNSINLEQYVQENLEQFVTANASIADVYENIKNFAVQETINLIDI
jgi:flagellar biosynthesis component FlhA